MATAGFDELHVIVLFVVSAGEMVAVTCVPDSPVNSVSASALTLTERAAISTVTLHDALAPEGVLAVITAEPTARPRTLP